MRKDELTVEEATAIAEHARSGSLPLDDPEVRRSVMDGFRTLDTRFETRLRRARDGGELGSDTDPTALALLATATLHTLALRARAGTSRKDLRTLASKAVGVICG